jgi:hypothetical protein
LADILLDAKACFLISHQFSWRQTAVWTNFAEAFVRWILDQGSEQEDGNPGAERLHFSLILVHRSTSLKKTWPLRPDISVKPHFINTIGQIPHYLASAVDVLREGLYHFLYDEYVYL